MRKDLDSNLFSKNKLEEFLKIKEINKKPKIAKKLVLITIVINDYNAEEKYNKLNDRIEEMNKKINELNFINKSLLKFHSIKFKDRIKQIAQIIEDIETKPIIEFKNKKMQDNITNLLKHQTRALDIDKVRNLLIFKIIFKNTRGYEEERFDKGKYELTEIKKSFKDYQDKIKMK